jgi:hypothetical protein
MKNILLILTITSSAFTTQAQQRVAFVGTLASSEAINSSSLSMPVNIPSTANCLTVTVSEFKKSFPLTITDITTSRSLTSGVSVISKAGSQTAIYYLVNPGTGSHTLKISIGTGNTANIKAIVSCYSGVDTEFPISNTSSYKNTVLNNSVAIDVNSASKQIVVDAINYEKQVSAETKGTSQTRIGYINTNGWNFASSYKEANTTSVNMAWDYSIDGGALWSIASLSLQPSSYNVVPVSLIDFVAKPLKNVIEFSWATNFESHTAFITLERSTDSRNWTDIMQVAAAGTSNIRKYYTAKDLSPLNVPAYYRLRVTNADGSRGFSNYLVVRAVVTAKTMELAQMPNPFSGSLQVRIVLPSNSDLTVRMMNFQGRVVAERSVKASSGITTISIDEAAALRSGMYALECKAGDDVISKIFIKQ